MTRRDALLESLAALSTEIREAGSSYLAGEPGVAADQLADVVIFARDVEADLRRLAEGNAA